MLDTETKHRIDTTRDILVGKVPDPKSQVEQITIALIYKFMDDIDAESEEFGGKRSFFAGEFARYGWAKLMHAGLGGHETLNLYAEAIAKMPENPGIPLLFRDIFKNAYLPYRDPETLRAFLKIIDEFTYDHSERLGDAFEYLLSVLGSQGDAGQFRTPRHIIDFIVAIIDPKKNEIVLDPACGTAGFLISSYKHILVANTDSQGNSTLMPDEKGRLAVNFKGYDISPDMVRLSLVNMYLHDFSDPHIFEYDTLTSEDRWNEYADVILANPPFMSPKGGIRPHNRFSVKSRRSEVLFVDYILEHLNVNGRGAVIVPDGLVSNTNAKFYTNLRKTLIDDNYLWAVVSMPSGIFKPYAGAKTSILFLDRQLGKKKKGILFINLENDGFDLGEQRKSIEKNDIPEIISTLNSYKDYRKVNYRNAHIIDRKLISDTRDYLLTGDFYLHQTSKKSSQHNYVPLGKIIKEVSTKVKDSQIPNDEIEPLSITMKEGLVMQSKKFNKRIANKDISGYKLVKRGQLVVGFPIDEGVLDILKIADYGAVSPAYSVWDVNNYRGLDLDYFNLVVKSDKALDIYRKLMNRTANRRRSIKKDFFLQIEIPIPPLNEQKKIVVLLEKASKFRIKADGLVKESRMLVNSSWD